MYAMHCCFLLLSIYISQVYCQHNDGNNEIGSLRGASALQSSPRGLQRKEKEYEVGLDFFIMGFPKTGTTAMMVYLDSNDELEIVGKPKKTENKEYQMYSEEDVTVLFDQIEQASLHSQKRTRYGIKWPGAVEGKLIGAKSLKLIEKYNPEGAETKLLIGMRHPVRWFESGYNMHYYIDHENAYGHGYRESPPTTSLIGYDNQYANVCTDRARFENGIMTLGKMPVPEDNRDWINRHEGYRNHIIDDGGTPYNVFLYLEEQLGDDNKERKGAFLEELSSFLEVKEPFTVDNDVPHSNTSKHEGINICDPEHQLVRDELVKNGKITAKWIRSTLAQAEGFVMPNKEHFLSITDTFGTDPCGNEEDSTV